MSDKAGDGLEGGAEAEGGAGAKDRLADRSSGPSTADSAGESMPAKLGRFRFRPARDLGSAPQIGQGLLVALGGVILLAAIGLLVGAGEIKEASAAVHGQPQGVTAGGAAGQDGARSRSAASSQNSGASGSAASQSPQCTLPAAVPTSALGNPRPDGPARPLPVSSYRLMLSWSPQFCRSHAGDPQNARQCSGEAGQFGFILHGLWPEGHGRNYPQWCATRFTVSPATARAQLCRTPSLYLVRHEWAKHGACMARDPASYYARANALMDSLTFPDMAALSRSDDLRASDVRAALHAANPAIPTSAFAIDLGRSGWLEEVGVCYDKRFAAQACPSGQAGVPDDARVKIWRGGGMPSAN